MALYLGEKLIAGGGSGNANIISCADYNDYISKLAENKAKNKLSCSYYIPDTGVDVDDSKYAKLNRNNVYDANITNTFNGNVTVAAGKKLEVTNALTANNSTLTAANLTVNGTTNLNGATNLNGSTTATKIDKLSATTPLPDSASLDDKSLIMSDSTKSYNVNYSLIKDDINSSNNPQDDSVAFLMLNRELIQTFDTNTAKTYTSFTIPLTGRLIYANSSLYTVISSIDDNVEWYRSIYADGSISSLCYSIYPAGTILLFSNAISRTDTVRYIPYIGSSIDDDTADSFIIKQTKIMINDTKINIGYNDISAEYRRSTGLLRIYHNDKSTLARISIFASTNGKTFGRLYNVTSTGGNYVRTFSVKYVNLTNPTIDFKIIDFLRCYS